MTEITDAGVQELLGAPNHAVLSSLNPDGTILSTVVWIDYVDGVLAVNSAVGRKWPTNLDRDGRVTVVVIDQQNPYHFTEIRDALEAGDEAHARQLLALWQRVDASELPRSEIVRHVIEYSVLAAHRHVFGVLAWYSILAAFGLGPAGAVLYRMAEFVTRYWRHRSEMQVQPASDALRSAAARAWSVVDWLPARITAIAFAVVGSFEEAIDCWRNYAQRFPDDNDGVILAATSGAVNVRLGGEALKPVFAPEASQGFRAAAVGAEAVDSASTPGREAEVAHLRSIVGLVWRSVVLWMVLLALLTLARLLG